MLVKEVMSAMQEYYKDDAKRAMHFFRVFSFAQAIGMSEGLDKKTQEILEVAAIIHDIGIKPAEEKYNNSTGKYQELEGIEPARKILAFLGADSDIIERVAYLVGHHHTYDNIDGIDYQILVEADFLVNAYEDGLSEQAIAAMRDKIFRTKKGLEFIEDVLKKLSENNSVLIKGELS